MADVTNFSDEAVVVIGKVTGQAQRKAWFLQSQRRTQANFNVEAVRANVLRGDIFDPNARPWWMLPGDPRVYVYNWSGFWTSMFKSKLFSLHCIPYLGSGGQPTYRNATKAEQVDLDRTPVDHALDLSRAPEFPMDPDTDGEYFHKPTLTKFAAKPSPTAYVRTREHIAVRIRLVPVNVSTALLNTLKSDWRTAIHDIWNGVSVPKPNGYPHKLSFEVHWVNAQEHHAVTVQHWINWLGNTQYSTVKWHPLADARGKRNVAHEFGHYLGLRDEYMFDEEAKWFYNGNKPLPKPLRKEEFRRGRLRHLDRSGNSCVDPENLMDNTRVVDRKMIDAIHQKQVQDLCFRQTGLKRVFSKHVFTP